VFDVLGLTCQFRYGFDAGSELDRIHGHEIAGGFGHHGYDRGTVPYQIPYRGETFGGGYAAGYSHHYGFASESAALFTINFF